jgi:hypothetical protein
MCSSRGANLRKRLSHTATASQFETGSRNPIPAMPAGRSICRRRTPRSATCIGRHDIDLGNTTHGAPTVRQDCPNDEAVTGMHIHYGKYVNAIGLICGQLQLQKPRIEAPFR